MKKFIKVTFFIIFLLVAVIIAAPFFIPLETVKKIASEKIKEMTGRDLVVAGDIKASVFPNIGVTLKNVTLSNPEGFSYKQMADIGELTAEVALMPLLNGKVEIKQIILSKPIIHLEVNKNRQANWQFGEVKKEEAGVDKSEQKAPSAAMAIPVLGNIKIENGVFSYKDQATGKNYSASDANLEVKLPSASSPLDLAAKLGWNGEKISVDLHADKPANLFVGGDTQVKVNAKIGSLLTVAFNGKAGLQGANGDIDLNSSSLVKLSALSGKKMQWKGAGALAFSLKSALDCSVSQCALSKAAIALDDNKLAGDVKIAFSGSVPAITAKLTSDKLDLNPLLPQVQKQAEKQAFLSLISDANAAQELRSDKLDLSGLRAVNADVSLAVANVLYQAISLNDVVLNLKLVGGALALDIPHVSLYGGTAKISATANSLNAISANINAENIQLEPFLKDAAQFEKLSGTANFDTVISGHGASQQAIISSLAGKGSIHIADGTIKGIDIAKLISSAKDMVTGADTASQKTNFSELGGTFTIAQGVVSNNDLAMKAPLLRLKGEGTVSLPTKTVNYRLTPTIVATLQGQGGKDKTGLAVPIIVSGTFDALKFHPDLQSMVDDALKNPEKMKETIKDVKGLIKNPDAVKGLLNGLGR